MSKISIVLSVDDEVVHAFAVTGEDTPEVREACREACIKAAFDELERRLYPKRHEMIVKALNGRQ
jgi:hypothetical protein